MKMQYFYTSMKMNKVNPKSKNITNDFFIDSQGLRLQSFGCDIGKGITRKPVWAGLDTCSNTGNVIILRSEVLVACELYFIMSFSILEIL